MKEKKIEIPAGCEVEKIETQDGHVVVTFRPKLPKTWEEFCEYNPVKYEEAYIQNGTGEVIIVDFDEKTRLTNFKDLYPDRATAEAVLALCQLIQLRECYNGGWKPKIGDDDMYIIDFTFGEISEGVQKCMPEILMFKTSELCDDFLRNFRPLIEKLKPLYGINEGGEK